MAKPRTMNELRQTKEYKIDPVQQVLAQQIEELAERDHQENLDKASAEGSKEFWPEDIKENTNAYHKQHIKECPLDPIFEAKNLIIDKITKHFQDVMFEMVSEEMSDNYLFQVDNYLTPAGYDEFEDEWFEFYHEHHGDILYEVMKNITN
jgi:flagellar biosynthesis/type III secretory pathway protein FliH